MRNNAYSLNAKSAVFKEWGWTLKIPAPTHKAVFFDPERGVLPLAAYSPVLRIWMRAYRPESNLLVTVFQKFVLFWGDCDKIHRFGAMLAKNLRLFNLKFIKNA